MEHELGFGTGKEDIEVAIELWDLAADVRGGLCLAKGQLELSWHSWKQGEVMRKSVKLQAPEQVEQGADTYKNWLI